MYVWILPLLSGAGLYKVVVEKGIKFDKIGILRVILVLTFIFQFLTMFYLKNAYIQYYLQLTWFLVVFVAFSIDGLLSSLSYSKLAQNICFVILFILFINLANVSLEANRARSKIRDNSLVWSANLRKIWSIIPESSSVFPNILYRPIGYPTAFGDEEFRYPFPQLVKQQLPKYSSYFQKNKTQYLIIDDMASFIRLEEGLENYVKNHYKLTNAEQHIWKRQ